MRESYRLGTEIARGGFGAVYRATHTSTGCDVAVKVLHDHLSKDPAVRARFRREAETLAQLKDQHVVTTYEFGELADGRLFIAMELLRGESLCDRLDRVGQLHWRRAIGIAREVARALIEAHTLGIVHRDLKPANIHLERWAGGEIVKVLDFGIAKLLDDRRADQLTRAGEVLGTIEYMAPEQIVDTGIDNRTDQFALGAVLYEMLTGTRPFGEVVTAASYVAKMLTKRPVPISEIIGSSPAHAAIDEILERCLASRPAHRFDSMVDLLAALDAIDDTRDERTDVARFDTDDDETVVGASFNAIPGFSAGFVDEPLHFIPWSDTPPTGVEPAAAARRAGSVPGIAARCADAAVSRHALGVAVTQPAAAVRSQPRVDGLANAACVLALPNVARTVALPPAQPVMPPLERPARGSIAPMPALAHPFAVATPGVLVSRPAPVRTAPPTAPVRAVRSWRIPVIVALGAIAGMAIGCLF